MQIVHFPLQTLRMPLKISRLYEPWLIRKYINYYTCTSISTSYQTKANKTQFRGYNLLAWKFCSGWWPSANVLYIFPHWKLSEPTILEGFENILHAATLFCSILDNWKQAVGTMYELEETMCVMDLSHVAKMYHLIQAHG